MVSCVVQETITCYNTILDTIKCGSDSSNTLAAVENSSKNCFSISTVISITILSFDLGFSSVNSILSICKGPSLTYCFSALNSTLPCEMLLRRCLAISERSRVFLYVLSVTDLSSSLSNLSETIPSAILSNSFCWGIMSKPTAELSNWVTSYGPVCTKL